MKVIIHDLKDEEFEKLNLKTQDYIIISARDKAAPCQGCFGCWFKSPGKCFMKDKLQNLGAALGESEEVIVISENCYGGYSEGVKRIFDRSISTSLPFFTYRNRRIHHCLRYKNKLLSFKVFFYGDIGEFERSIAKEFVEANGSNNGAKRSQVVFLSNVQELKEVLK